MSLDFGLGEGRFQNAALCLLTATGLLWAGGCADDDPAGTGNDPVGMGGMDGGAGSGGGAGTDKDAGMDGGAGTGVDANLEASVDGSEPDAMVIADSGSDSTVDAKADAGCAERTADCDGDPGNGCEANTQTDLAHCGACGSPCAESHGTAECVAGICVLSCEAGYGNCDERGENGCEANIATDPNRCGACDEACAGAPNADASCVDGRCGVECRGGYADCDRKIANGCEVDLNQDLAHCGQCGTACNPSGVEQAVCEAGVCTYTSCQSQRGDCDTNRGNGCETDLASVANCGACGTPCELNHAAPSCAAGVCQLASCDAGWDDCDGRAGNGCETDLSTVNACGACGIVCSTANATASCVGGSCTFRCNDRYADCDGSADNGCEAQLDTNNHCGSCGRTCTPPAYCVTHPSGHAACITP